VEPLPDLTSAPVVRRALAAAFPDLSLKAPKLLVAGAEYVTWTAGPYVVKFPRSQDDADRLEHERAVLALAATRIGEIVPGMTELGTPTDEFPLAIAVYEKARGRQGQQSDGPMLSPKPWARVGLAKATAATLSTLHATPAAAARKAGVPKLPLSLDPGFEVSEGALDWATRVAGDRVDAFLIDPLPAEARTVTGPVFCHGGIKGEHLFVSEDGTRLIAIIDWADAKLCDPAADLAGLVIWLGPSFMREVLERYTGPTDDGTFDRAVFSARAGLLSLLDAQLSGRSKASVPLLDAQIRAAFGD